jgi:hypothetical protein
LSPEDIPEDTPRGHPEGNLGGYFEGHLRRHHWRKPWIIHWRTIWRTPWKTPVEDTLEDTPGKTLPNSFIYRKYYSIRMEQGIIETAYHINEMQLLSTSERLCLGQDSHPGTF